MAAARRQLVRANRAIESAERRCHFWCDAKTLQWQLKVITRAINAATAAAATAKTQRQQRAGLEWQQPKMAKPEAAKRKNRRVARKAKAEKNKATREK